MCRQDQDHDIRGQTCSLKGVGTLCLLEAKRKDVSPSHCAHFEVWDLMGNINVGEDTNSPPPPSSLLVNCVTLPLID